MATTTILRWYPDTCACRLRERIDDGVVTCEEVEQACVVHLPLKDDPQACYEQVLAENQAKNQAEAMLREVVTRLITVTPTPDGPVEDWTPRIRWEFRMHPVPGATRYRVTWRLVGDTLMGFERLAIRQVWQTAGLDRIVSLED